MTIAADLLLRAIKSVIADKTAQARTPTHALLIGDAVYSRVCKEKYIERDDFREALRELIVEGCIQYGATINDTYIEVL